MKVRIHVRSRDQDEVLQFEEALSILYVGRSRAADIQLDDPRVARKHCGLRMEPGAVFVVDFGSTNGTFVNGERVTQQDIQIEDRAELRVGNTTLTLYVETGDAEARASEPNARNEELEARIRTDPADTTTYLVYADWLAEQGEPRAELITVHHRLDEALRADPPDPGRVERLRSREVALLDEHGMRLLGPLVFYQPMINLEWRNGFVRVARLGVEQTHSAGRLASAFRSLLLSPASAFIEEIHVGRMDWGAGLLFDALEELRPPTLRTLTIGAPSDPLYFPAQPERVFDSLDALERLEFFGRRWVRGASGAPEPDRPQRG